MDESFLFVLDLLLLMLVGLVIAYAVKKDREALAMAGEPPSWLHSPKESLPPPPSYLIATSLSRD